jgi:hypothetical protein
MSKIPTTVVDPEKPQSIVKAVTEIARVVDGNVEFGNPQNPYDDQDDTLAGSDVPTTHNGFLQNIKGSWVEEEIGSKWALGAAVTCYHNLNVPVAVAGLPNVRWLVFGFQHDGNGVAADTTCTVSANFQAGDTVATDSIQLRFYAAGARVVDQTHLLKVTLFFTPAVR